MPLLIAHRGSHSATGPVENTLPAFEQAIADGADMVELDVWETADGELVVYHDDKLPGVACPIHEMTWAAIRKTKTDRGAVIPTLASALELMRKRIPVNVEIKHGDALGDVLRLVRDLGMSSEIILSSFVLPAIYEAADRAPEVARALIMGTESLHPWIRFRESFPFWALRRARARFWHPSALLTGPASVGALATMGVQTNAWTVNDAATARRLFDWGIGGIFTDRPGDMRAALAL